MTPEEQATAETARKAEEARRAEDARKAEETKPRITSFVGAVGGPFNLHGVNLGMPSLITIAGRPLNVSAWSDVRIKGTIPRDMKPGPVEVSVNGATFKTKI